MFLLEHDAKELLAGFGVPVPPGTLIEAGADMGSVVLPPGPWVVKAQVPTGGRGKAGGIRKADSTEEVRDIVGAMLGSTIKGIRVRSCRVESQVAGASEAYLSLAIDPVEAGVRVMMAPIGGIEVEALAHQGAALHSRIADSDPVSLGTCVRSLAEQLPANLAGPMADAGTRFAEMLLGAECELVEINPLFVTGDGGWVAGDAKVVADGNAVVRRAELQALLAGRALAYQEAALKWEHGFDYVVVDPKGEIGLLTTGAGLSMMLIDEMQAAGLKPYNFLDIRTGGLRGDPTRLIKVLNWIAEGPEVSGLLVNIFAGITHLGEFSRLLIEAFESVPVLDVPVVTRLVGTGLADAREVFAAAQRAIELHTDLDAALARIVAIAGEKAPRV